MFVCEKCIKPDDRRSTLPISLGKCERCGTLHECYEVCIHDRPSDNLCRQHSEYAFGIFKGRVFDFAFKNGWIVQIEPESPHPTSSEVAKNLPLPTEGDTATVSAFRLGEDGLMQLYDRPDSVGIRRGCTPDDVLDFMILIRGLQNPEHEFRSSRKTIKRSEMEACVASLLQDAKECIELAKRKSEDMSLRYWKGQKDALETLQRIVQHSGP